MTEELDGPVGEPADPSGRPFRLGGERLPAVVAEVIVSRTTGDEEGVVFDLPISELDAPENDLATCRSSPGGTYTSHNPTPVGDLLLSFPKMATAENYRRENKKNTRCLFPAPLH